MSDETKPQDGKAMSPASAGSQPVAWAVFDGPDRMHLAPGYGEAESCAEDIGGEIVPLYRKPMLEDEELKAIRRAAAVAREMHDSRLEAALGGLLERLD